MSYIINKYNSEQIASVEDGTINTTLDIKLIGKNTAGYGESQNENFVWLLENFAKNAAPPKAITGQLWYNTETEKLRVNYGTGVWHTLGINDVVSNKDQAVGLTQGDLFWITDEQQLWCKGELENILIGGKLDNINTQMKHSTVDSNATPPVRYDIIEAVINGVTTFVVSSASTTFTLAASETLKVAGWTVINPGITVKGYEAVTKTSPDFKYWGSATNAERLGGVAAADYVTSSNAIFSDVAIFSESGIAVGGEGNEILYILKQGDIPTIKNVESDSIDFITTVSSDGSSNLVYPMKLVGKDIMPGTTSIEGINPSTWSNIGSASNKFNEVYANSFVGNASSASALKLDTTSYSLSTDATAATVVARTATAGAVVNGYSMPAGSITAAHVVATAFMGNASSATGLMFETAVRNPSVASSSGTVVVRSHTVEIVTIDGAAHSIPVGSIKAAEVHATLYGNASSASKLMVGTEAYPAVAYALTADIEDLNGAIVARTSDSTTVTTSSGSHTLPAGSIQAVEVFATQVGTILADLAEKYASDVDYEVGTVVMIGGELEITAAVAGNRALGVISANPAYLMNVMLADGIPVALKGRVPVKVVGEVKKGDRLIASDEYGFAQALVNSKDAEFVFAIALSTNDNNVVEAVII